MDKTTDRKRDYSPPRLRTECIEIGVFGNYGGGGGGGGCHQRRNPPVAFFNPFFHFCCS